MSYKRILNLTPEEAWSGYKPSVVHMKVFGCTTYAHVPKEKRRKLDDKSVKCIFIGYSIETRSYRLFDPQEKKVMYFCIGGAQHAEVTEQNVSL
jgi:hypothetical protein